MLKPLPGEALKETLQLQYRAMQMQCGWPGEKYGVNLKQNDIQVI